MLDTAVLKHNVIELDELYSKSNYHGHNKPVIFSLFPIAMLVDVPVSYPRLMAELPSTYHQWRVRQGPQGRVPSMKGHMSFGYFASKYA